MKLLQEINSSKASGPDQVPCRILRELSVELAPVLRAIFTQSLETGMLPSICNTSLQEGFHLPARELPACQPHLCYVQGAGAHHMQPHQGPPRQTRNSLTATDMWPALGPFFYLCPRTCLDTVLAKTIPRQVLDRSW